MSGPEVITLGCRLNAFESEIVRDHAIKAGFDGAIIFNTCAVTKEAERQAGQAIRRARRNHPDARIVVTGCAAQLNPAKYAAMPEVDHVVGNEEKLKPETFLALAGGGARLEVADIMTVRETAPHLVHGFDGRNRAFVQIQQGCDHRCTFCIIPFARGNNRSVPLGGIVEQTRALVREGYREVVLTGVDICSYGSDLPGKPTLGEAVRRLLAQVPELERLRLSSLDPAAMDDALFEALASEPRLMPHLHLSLQAMDDTILKRMKRRHLRGDAFRVAARARAVRPDIVLGADLIAGFPTETDAMFERTLASVDELGLTHLHVFPYSERDGTPAARMPALTPSVRKARAAKLRATGERALERFLKTRIGGTAQVLIEQNGVGLSEHYASVRIAGAKPGDLVSATITGIDGANLVGQIVQ
ncbi:MAG: tRNA (N(6)-L-threonylcarbamoyladenosine(37)-C(2))-methylthiotransferase MtaB [Proteobacteria bacterium]|nr:tRNA (N(6)-L-threonylcarbamoyladenosine(37)-C(2))-methylthiotransferase MtaB [Pseudomonadota bacterium]